MSDSTARTPHEEENAPLVANSGGASVALFGLIGPAVSALLIWIIWREFSVFALAILSLIFAVCVVYPLWDEVSSAIVCDDEGLTIRRFWNKQRVAFGDIEELFLLTPPGEPENSGIPAIVVSGKPIILGSCGDKHELLLERIERNVGGSLRFAKRDFIPVGSSLTLPKTFEYRDDSRDWRQARRFLIGAVALKIGVIALLFWRAGTQFVPLHLLAVWYGLWLLWNLVCRKRRMNIGREKMRARRGESIEVDEDGLQFRSPSRDVRLDWEQITRLERDCVKSKWKPIYRVEGAGQSFAFYGFYRLADLLRERCGLVWEEAPHLRQLAYGIKREGEVLIVRADNEGARMQRLVWFYLWYLATFITLLPALWNTTVPLSAIGAKFLSCLLPPPGLLLYLAIATTISLRRVVTRCDENGLTHQGWFAPRTMKWGHIESHGTRSLWIWLRSREGRTLRIWSLPLIVNAQARRELRDEIRRRAPHAQSCW